MPKRPFEHTALTKFVYRRLLKLKPVGSQGEIAEEAGFVSPNMMSMLRSGATKLPVDRVPARLRSCSSPAFGAGASGR
ncbi:hypothetical protein [Falsirhodobacter sp. 1013]|uniref:hypothetical protein n=1 Tax=Falsirhodobacter sp. 1013 TaxID=3417566 RepID=UPI003EBE215F